jgi:predicted transcriptional regulator with HTH domain
MDDYRQQQIDVLKEAVPYSEKLIGAIEKVSDELAGVPFPETHDAVNIIEGLNWLFEVYNGTKDIIEVGAVDEAEANSGVKELSEAVKAADDVAVSKALVRLSTFVKQLHDAGSRLINE